ncbi:MAG: hypothetical protein ABW022_08595 [Actinoplanes sp.]
MNRTGWIARRLGRDRNPVCRPTDRIEARCTALLVLVLMIAGPLLAAWTASATYRADVRQQEWDSLHRFRVQADVVGVAPPKVSARWLAPDGTRRTGALPARPGAAPGSRIAIWVDERGTPSGPPTQNSPHGTALIVATVVFVTLGAAAAGMRAAMMRVLDRRRMRQWQDEWLDVEPRWSSRL